MFRKIIRSRNIFAIVAIFLMLIAPVFVFASEKTPTKEDIKSFILNNKDVFFDGVDVEIKQVDYKHGIIDVLVSANGSDSSLILTNSLGIVSQIIPISKLDNERDRIGKLNQKTGELVVDDSFKEELKSFIKEKMLPNDKDYDVVISNIEKQDGFYKIDVKIAEQSQPIYLNGDGSIFFFDIKTLDYYKKMIEDKKKLSQVSDENKSDKPKVDLFVMSYCPYGTQIEKGMLPVFKALGDKIDGKIRFVDYAMHDKKEVDENLLQYCIQKTKPEKYHEYLNCFLEKGDSKSCLEKFGLDEKNEDKSIWQKIIDAIKSFFGIEVKDNSKNEIEKCIEETDKEFKISENYSDKSTWKGNFPGFDIDKADNEKYNVAGSPTLIINGQKVQPLGRDSQSLLNAICTGFKNPPEECKQKMSNDQPSPGFGSGTTSGSSTNAGGCGQ